MTTAVEVKAYHDRPVDVTAIDPVSGDVIPNYGGRLQPGEAREFVATSTQDLLIHEVQPDEIAAEQPAEEQQGEGEASEQTAE
jgi:hypothetical protein